MEGEGYGLDDSIAVLLLIQLLLIALNAVFACAEIAVLSVNEAKMAKLAEQGNRKAKRITRLTARPAQFLATIQVAITLSGFLGSALAAENFSDRLVAWLVKLGVGVSPATLNTVAVVAITLVLSYVTLIFGELIPKRLAMKKSEQLAMGLSGLISAISTVFAPVVWFLSVSTNAVLRLIGVDPNEKEENVSEEEIRMMVDAGSENGSIDHEEKEFIQNLFEFDDLSAGEIATHRTEVAVLWMEDSMEEWERTIHETRHTRYPVCGESSDHVIGILNAKDYFRLKDKSRESVMASAVKPAYFVSENIKADVLFGNMKAQRKSLCVVLDEYGGMVGIVTMSDLIEQLVGEWNSDESQQPHEAPRIQQGEADAWTVTGNIALRDIEEVTGVELEEGEYDTLTGLVFNALGMIPQDGKQNIDLDIAPLHIHIGLIREHQIEQATIRLTPVEE
jgi:putative hemolysin